jgi:hypothetical protein
MERILKSARESGSLNLSNRSLRSRSNPHRMFLIDLDSTSPLL